MAYEPRINPIADFADSYKESHPKQVRPGIRAAFSYLESRGGEPGAATFFGLQYFLKRYWSGPVIEQWMIDEAAAESILHFGRSDVFSREGWQRVVDVHGGHIPVRISAVPEGTTVPNKNILMAIESTDPEIPWMGQFMETMLSEIWYPTTIASRGRVLHALITKYLTKTSDLESHEVADFMLHDFGYRGSTSPESAGIGGMAHLVHFKGTDTRIALRYAKDYYAEPMAGFSVPAAEHFTISSWGKNKEVDAYRHILSQFPEGTVSIVSDTWDVFHACETHFGKTLKNEVVNRPGTLVNRPDSGKPTEVVPKVLHTLGDAFGYHTNSKNYKVLPATNRVIQGDGIKYDTIEDILISVMESGWSTENLFLGSGGGLLQELNRDTMKFAFKCCAVDFEGEWMDVYKDPITDPGKTSKAGRLALVKQDGCFVTIREEERQRLGLANELVPYFENGVLLRDDTFAEIRARAVA